MIFRVGFSSGKDIEIGPAKWRWAEKSAFQFPRGDVGISKRGIFAIVICNTWGIVCYIICFLYAGFHLQPCQMSACRNSETGEMWCSWYEEHVDLFENHLNPSRRSSIRLGKMRRSFWAWSQTHFTCQVKDFDKEPIKYFFFIVIVIVIIVAILMYLLPQFNTPTSNKICKDI